MICLKAEQLERNPVGDGGRTNSSKDRKENESIKYDVCGPS